MPAQTPEPSGVASTDPALPGEEARRRAEELDRQLSRGERELPPNQVKGVLGEKGFDLYKVDEFEPDLNSGISQEIDLPVVWAGIVLLFLTVLLAPVGIVVLWRSKLISKRAKIIWTVVALAWVAGVLLYVRFS